MNKTFQISFSLRNTYRVNSILYALKQVPLLKKLLPDALYQVQGLKVLANIISIVWEVVSVFLGKFLYFAVMIAGIGLLYKSVPGNQLFLHILLFLSFVGALTNTFMFHPSKDKYYAIVLMRMNAKEYTLTNYCYSILKVIVGFIPFSILFGLDKDLPLWILIIIPFAVAGLKMTVAAYSLWDYKKHGHITNENGLDKFVWAAIAVFCALAYLPPAFGYALPVTISAGFMVLSILFGAVSVPVILKFSNYRDMYRQILSGAPDLTETAVQRSIDTNRKAISADLDITSRKNGFEYLNELFIKRHKKILWKASNSIALVCLVLFVGVLPVVYFMPEIKEGTNQVLMTFLPYFVFIMYAINRGTGFTQALFMNCDHSLLTYSFYKQPKQVLKLFRIRLREIIKINLLPAVVIGAGLSVLLFVSGGTENPLNYGVIFVSITCMSIFFSVHYLTIYYLLQPYNAETEIKSGTYKIVMAATYLICFYMMQLKMPTFVFGLMTILFCVLYCILACVLIYKFAPKTFRLRT